MADISYLQSVDLIGIIKLLSVYQSLVVTIPGNYYLFYLEALVDAMGLNQ